MPAPAVPTRLRAHRWAWWLLAGLVLGLLLSMAWGARSVYQQREQRYHHQIEGGLRAISLLQVRNVADWRRQHIADAAALTDDGLFAQAAARWHAAPSEALQEPLRERLRSFVEHGGYSAAFWVDARGALRLGPQGALQGMLASPEQQALRQALAQAEPVAVELHRDAAFAFAIFGVLAPVFDGDTPLGAVWLVSDARTQLFPQVESWPSASRSAESLLVQRDGDELVYVSPLRHRSDAPLSLRQAIVPGRDVVVQAVAGARGVVYGSDYRGQEVLALVSAVPDSPWVLVSKLDVDEAFVEAQRGEWLALALLASLALLSGGCAAAAWQWRAWRRERGLKLALERNMRWLDSAQKAASAGYFAYDAEHQKFFMSSMAHAIFGLPPQEYMTLQQWMDMVHPEDCAHVLQVHAEAIAAHTPLGTQYRIVRASDGAQRWLQVWGEYGDGTDTDPLRMTGTVQDITERKQAEQQLARYRDALEERVRLDPMTQVANRLALGEAMQREWERARLRGMPLALLMIDVDFFKAYNDHYGHVAGDRCLQRVAQALASAVQRSGELAARYGGEEFAVLLPDSDELRAVAVAHRLREAVRELALEHQASPCGAQVTISVGVACVRPADGQPLEHAQTTLFQQADEALYRAKQAGRDRVALYGTDVQAEPPPEAAQHG
ncbi:MAG: diguanylate cyclase [Giesbergeria sp.]|jgi:diguanylate cyclase (GGDEF)-like protein/PAS domain S-box-containing protein|nr:diguanylate cyclase [Giesbergeria sp.]